MELICRLQVTIGVYLANTILFCSIRVTQFSCGIVRPRTKCVNVCVSSVFPARLRGFCSNFEIHQEMGQRGTLYVTLSVCKVDYLRRMSKVDNCVEFYWNQISYVTCTVLRIICLFFQLLVRPKNILFWKYHYHYDVVTTVRFQSAQWEKANQNKGLATER